MFVKSSWPIEILIQWNIWLGMNGQGNLCKECKAVFPVDHREYVHVFVIFVHRMKASAFAEHSFFFSKKSFLSWKKKEFRVSKLSAYLRYRIFRTCLQVRLFRSYFLGGKGQLQLFICLTMSMKTCSNNIEKKWRISIFEEFLSERALHSAVKRVKSVKQTIDKKLGYFDVKVGPSTKYLVS